jgi:large repetitive protein
MRSLVSLMLASVLFGQSVTAQDETLGRPALSSEQSALMNVFGPRAPILGGRFNTQVIWFSVPAARTSRTFVQIFDADCGGRWDLVRGSANTKTTFSLFAAPDATDESTVRTALASGKSTVASLGTPIAQLTAAQEAIYDSRWHALAGITAAQGRTEGSNALFVLVIQSTAGNGTNRFDVALSSESKLPRAIPGTTMWVHEAAFRLRTPSRMSAEARFEVPAGAKSVTLRTLNAANSALRINTPVRSNIHVRALKSGRPTETEVVPVDGEAGSTWAFTGRYLAPGSGDVVISALFGRPLRMWLPIGIARVNRRPVATFSVTPFSDCTTLLFDADKSTDPDRDLLSYSWDFGDGNTAKGVRQTHKFTKSGSFHVTLTITDVSGRVNSVQAVSRDIPINLPPVARFAAPKSGAVATALSFDASKSADPDGKLTSYIWDFGDGGYGKGKIIHHRYDRPGLYRVTLTVVDNVALRDNPCNRNTTTADVFVNAAPVAKINAPERGSPGQRLTFDASASMDSDGDLASIVWDFGDGSTGNGVRTSHAYKKPGTYTVRLTVADDSGTSSSHASDRTKIHINAHPVAVAGNAIRVAVNEITRFNGRRSSDADGSIKGYRWNFGDGQSAETSVARHAYAKPGRYTAKLTVEDNSGTTSSTSSDTLSVFVNAQPVAVAGPDQTISTSSALLDGTRSSDRDGKIISYRWNFGDGNTSRSAKVRHVYRSPGTYTVVLRVRDDSGTRSATARDTTIVTINALPVANISFKSSGRRGAVAPGETIRLDARSSKDAGGSASRYSWNFGDGQSATGPVVSHAWKDPGKYRVRLTVADNSGHARAMDARERLIAVNQPPIANIILPKGLLLSPKVPAVFDGQDSYDNDGNIVEYQWEFGDGTTVRSGSGHAWHTFAKPGTYTVKLTVKDNSGVANNTAEITTKVRINAPPIADAGKNVIGCGTTVSLDATKSSDPDGDRMTYRWSFRDGTRGYGSRVIHTFPQAGSYRVKLMVTDDSGMRNSRDSAYVRVRVNRPPVAIAGKDREVCAGQKVLFSGSKSTDRDRDKLSYSWDFGDGKAGTGMNVHHSYDKAGDYLVKLTVKDDTGLPCNIDEDVILVRVGQSPVAHAGGDRTVCRGTTVDFDGRASTGVGAGHDKVTYRWSFGDGTFGSGALASHSFRRAGTYNVRLTVQTARVGTCPASNTDTVVVVVKEYPKAIFEAPRSIVQGEDVTFDASKSDDAGSKILEYVWDFGDGTTATGKVSKHRYTKTGSFRVRLRISTDACEGCNVAITQKNVRVNPPRTMFTASALRSLIPERANWTRTWIGGQGTTTARPLTGPRGSRHDLAGAVNEQIPFTGPESKSAETRIIDYQWNFGDGTRANGFRTIHAFKKSGLYSVTLRSQFSTGQSMASTVDTLMVRINEAPTARITMPRWATLGKNVTFSAKGSRDSDGKIDEYLWTFGDGKTARGMSVTHAYSTDGKYQVMLMVTDNSGTANASSTTTKVLRVNNSPIVIVTTRPTLTRVNGISVACPRQVINFDGGHSHDYDGKITSYSWDFGDGAKANRANVAHAFKQPGRYKVVLTLNDDSETESGTVSSFMWVYVNAPPVAIAGSDTTILIGGAHDDIWFDGSKSHDPEKSVLTYRWQFGDGGTAKGMRVRHAYKKPGRYVVRLTVSDDTRGRCSSSTARFIVRAKSRRSATTAVKE